jgi:predicted DNA-binding transcriptional regulator AlpA
MIPVAEIATSRDVEALRQELQVIHYLLLDLTKKVESKPAEERLLTTKEAARIMGLSPGYLRNARVDGSHGLPLPVTVGIKAKRYRYSDVMEYMKRKGKAI